jgi:hypothetical protein
MSSALGRSEGIIAELVSVIIHIANPNSQFRRNALFALVGSVSSISTITIFPLSFYCSEKRGQNRRLGHDWNWAMRYSLEISSSRSLRLSVTKPHHAYVSLPRQLHKQKKHPKTIMQVPTCCTYISRQFRDERAMRSPPHPPSVVDSRRPLFNAAFRSSVARSRNA